MTAGPTTPDTETRLCARSRVAGAEGHHCCLLKAVTSYIYSVTLRDGVPVATEHTQGCLATTGYSEEDYQANPYLWIEMVHPDDRAMVQRSTEETLAGRDVPPIEHRILRKDGTLRWVRSVTVPRRDKHGLLTGYDGLIEDITDRKAFEKQLEAALEAAQAANRAKSRFLAAMSHEIRTPMTAIVGFSDLLLGDLTVPEQVAWAEAIRRNAGYLLSIIDDLLNIAKIEAGRLVIESVPCRPAEIVADVLATLQPRASAKRVGLTVEIEPSLPRDMRSDPTRLRQIIFNLVGNAVKFTSRGDIRVVVRSGMDPQRAPCLECQVTDSGIGMTQQQLGNLFKPFEQGNSRITRKFGGTGLGLAISKGLAEAMGGSIVVASELGRGSTFTLRLPLRACEDPTPAPASAAPLCRSADLLPATSSVLARRRVLVAEDGVDTQRLLVAVLKLAGAEVEVVEDGAQAIRRVDAARRTDCAPDGQVAKPFDLILMDMQMPVLDGYAATRQLRQTGYRGPIVALTAYALPEDRQKYLDAGCDDYIAKPFDWRKLIDTVRRHVGPPDGPQGAQLQTSDLEQGNSLPQSPGAAAPRTGGFLP